MNRKLSIELQYLQAGLAGYMLRVSPNDEHNDILLQRLSNAIEMAYELEKEIQRLTDKEANKCLAENAMKGEWDLT